MSQRKLGKLELKLLGAGRLRRHTCKCCAASFWLIATLIAQMAAQAAIPAGADPVPQPAIPAILAAFDKYEVVAMPEAHGMKDVDDFILSLIRDPAFPNKVNDIEVECGNSLYQPILDRYIAGENVTFKEAQKAWRNTTQPMCGMSTFFEQFFPLVRAINQKLPAAKRLRVLAGDPPIDWDQVKTVQELSKFMNRDPSITSVMEKEVLEKHRKALMLFGVMHLLHSGDTAVSAYEQRYPNLTLVISDFGSFDLGSPAISSKVFAGWPNPALVPVKGTWLGALGLEHFLEAPIFFDMNCKVRNEFPKKLQRPMAELVDAFLYLGPPEFRLKEQTLAYIALDADYRKELERRDSLPGAMHFFSIKDDDEEIPKDAEDPIDHPLVPPDTKTVEQDCLNMKKNGPPGPAGKTPVSGASIH